MRINHNITALNTYNKLSANQATTAKSLEKLSSGLKINRAGDNAAGLAISEKMRGQIRGLDQSTSNANDAISLIKTAEGALNETHSILQRMRELAVQSSNDTNTTADRGEIQKEIDQLNQEITRISTDTEFNTKKLLNGDYGTKVSQSGGTTNIEVKSSLSSTILPGDYTISVVSGALQEEVAGSATFSGVLAADSTLVINDVSIDFSAGTYTIANVVDAINGAENTGVTARASGTRLVVTANDFGTKGEVIITGTGSGLADFLGGGAITTQGRDAYISGVGSFTADGKTVTITNGGLKGMEFTVKASTATDIGISVTRNELDFQIGANSGQSMSMGLEDMSAKSLKVNDLDLSTADKATAAITTIDDAIANVSSERAKLGSIQNRLEHTINNLGTSSENLSSAESRIRDVDMAKEMMEFTKNNILAQAAQSMLAQANQQPQGVLQLLQ